MGKMNKSPSGNSSRILDYRAGEFLGVDLTTHDGACDDRRLPYSVNMYHDKEKRNAASLETFPGFRLLPKHFSGEGKILGIYAHRFGGEAEKDSLIVHRGNGLYVFTHGSRDEDASLSPICQVASDASYGFSFDGSFYLLDGKTLWLLSSPSSCQALGDDPYTDGMKTSGLLPKTNAYIPTVKKNGAVWEERNALTGYYKLEKTFCEEDSAQTGHGLLLAKILYEGKDALEVVGFEKRRTLAFVPAYEEYEGKQLPIVRIAPGAFRESDVKTAILSPSVKEIAGGAVGAGEGAFYDCKALETVAAYGVKTVGADAFAFCSSLKTVIFGKAVEAMDSSAIYGTSALSRVFFESPDAPSFAEYFPSSVSVNTDTFLRWGEVGKTLYLPCNPVALSKIYTLSGAEYDALTDFEDYNGIYDEETERIDGYLTRGKHSAPLTECFLQCFGNQELSRYLFATVTERNGLLAVSDAVTSFRLPLPDRCEKVVSLTVDGDAPEKSGVSFTLEKANNGEDDIAAVTVTFPHDSFVGRRVEITCYGEGSGFGKEGVKGCRFGAVFDGRIFLGGNPQYPDTLFYSLSPREGGEESAYFGGVSLLSLKEKNGAVVSLLPTPTALVALKSDPAYGGSVFMIERGQEKPFGHASYLCRGASGAPLPLGAVASLKDEPLFLSDQGVYAISKGNAYEEERLENRSYYIDGALLAEKKLASSVMAVWKGYLVLLCDGKIFLGDPDGSSRQNGTRQYEWFYLADIGSYPGQGRCYRHLASVPYRDGIPLTRFTVNGKPLFVKGCDEVAKEAVFASHGEDGGETSDFLLYYTVEIGDGGEEKCYLVDHYGEMSGGAFSPATSLCVLGDLLYFGTEDGRVFCFNTDKRGVAPLVNGKAYPVAEDEIHSSYYTFNGRAYESGFATAFSDGGFPHRSKSTERKSSVLQLRAMPLSGFTLSVRTETGGFHKVTDVVGTDAFSEKDLTKESFSPEERQLLLFSGTKQPFVKKQFLLQSSGFCSPFAIDFLAYRYRVVGRVREK